jgi:hypothetical protein
MDQQNDRTRDQNRTADDSSATPESVDSGSLKPPARTRTDDLSVAYVEAEDSAIHTDEGKDHLSPSEKALAARLKQAEIWMIVLTAIIAGATIINIIVYYCESESSTKIMSDVADKTGAVVDSMNSALGASRDALAEALKQNRNALEAAKLQSESSMKASERQSRASLDASIGSWHAEQRPWVEADLVATGSPFIQGNTVAIRVTTTLKNTGRSPAVNACVSSRMVPWLLGEENPERAHIYWRNIVESVCADAGRSLFPKTTVFSGRPVEVFPETLISLDLTPYIPQRADVQPAIVTCVDYEFPFPGPHHKTRYVSMIGKRPNEGGLITFENGVPRVYRPESREIIPFRVHAD